MAGLHALIVEDELLIGLGLQAMLSELGFVSFAFAGTARQALEQARLHCPDLVTLDMRLLDGDGFQASDAIEAECGPIPVIYVTGDATTVASRSGAVVLEKPVTTGALHAALGQARQKARGGRRPGGAAATVMEL
jgi:CheY-like chemotaxis protein